MFLLFYHFIHFLLDQRSFLYFNNNRMINVYLFNKKFLKILLFIFIAINCTHVKHSRNKYKGEIMMKKATFAAGCFWGIQAKFQVLKGVYETSVGYTGGNIRNPTYKLVCYGNTGHAEAVEIVYNPREITYEELLEVFWNIHDPTQVNRQGPDIGSQYRSEIFYHSEKQKKLAELSKTRINNEKFNGKIATKITKADAFWKAEEYHQDYYKKNGLAACPK